LDVREGSLLTLELKRAYNVPVRDPRVSDLITWYVVTLQKAIDIIWDNIRWELRKPKLVRRNGTLQTIMGFKLHNPIIPKGEKFNRMLRDELMKDNPYAAHWVDAIIRKAYSIIKSWRKRYLKGKARKAKPRIKRRFAKCKITLMKVDYKEKSIRITMKPHEYLEITWRGTWFEKRVEGWLVGEVTLKDDRIIIPFKNYKVVKIMDVIGWDSNELELTGYTPRTGFIHIDLRPLQSMKIVYEKKKRVAQSKGKRELYEKYVRRERNKVRDFMNKLASQLIRTFPNTLHVFEDLEKEDMIGKGRVGKERRKRNARTPWKTIHRKIGEKALTARVPARNTSKTCSRCRFKVRDLRGQELECPRCGLKMNRQGEE
jgi:putative transposase